MPRPPAAVSPPPSQSRSVSLSSLRETERLPPARTRARAHLSLWMCECCAGASAWALVRWRDAAARRGDGRADRASGRGPHHETIRTRRADAHAECQTRSRAHGPPGGTTKRYGRGVPLKTCSRVHRRKGSGGDRGGRAAQRNEYLRPRNVWRRKGNGDPRSKRQRRRRPGRHGHPGRADRTIAWPSGLAMASGTDPGRAVVSGRRGRAGPAALLPRHARRCLQRGPQRCNRGRTAVARRGWRVSEVGGAQAST